MSQHTHTNASALNQVVPGGNSYSYNYEPNNLEATNAIDVNNIPYYNAVNSQSLVIQGGTPSPPMENFFNSTTQQLSQSMNMHGGTPSPPTGTFFDGYTADIPVMLYDNYSSNGVVVKNESKRPINYFESSNENTNSPKLFNTSESTYFNSGYNIPSYGLGSTILPSTNSSLTSVHSQSSNLSAPSQFVPSLYTPLLQSPAETVFNEINPSNSNGLLNANQDIKCVNSLDSKPLNKELIEQKELTDPNKVYSSDSLLSIVPLTGHHSFAVHIDKQPSNKYKYCFSSVNGTLYTRPHILVPVCLTMKEWVAGTVIIMPLYKNSGDILTPVRRCFNCQTPPTGVQEDPRRPDDIVHLNNVNAQYHVISDHHCVSIPVAPPSHGADSVNLVIKIACKTSCDGGPKRKPFCLSFIYCVNNCVLGRSIINVQSCMSPWRDMSNYEDKLSKKFPIVKPTKRKCLPNSNESHPPEKKKKVSLIVDDYTELKFKVKYLAEVKKYIKFLRYCHNGKIKETTTTDESDCN